MEESKSNPGVKAVLDEMLLGLPGVKPGKMFGYEAYYVLGKMSACIYEDGVGIKVPEEEVSRLLAEPYVVPFQPLGRQRMREWVQINREKPEEYRQDEAIFLDSVAFVRRIAVKGK